MDQIESAFEHLMTELLLPQMKSSLRVDYEKAQKAHDSTHEFMFLASNIVSNSEKYSIKTNMVYFLHHWEIFDQAQRSNIEALCTYYNSAFVLLRTILELLIKGVFFDCLAHKKFRNNSIILDHDKKGKRLKCFLEEIIKIAPQIEKDFEENSISISDKLDDYLKESDNVLTTRTMLRQIISWKIFEGIEEPENLIYGLYQKLSADVHVVIDNTDIGRRLLTNRDLFKEREIMPEYLSEYLKTLHTIIDICIVSLVNILKDNIKGSDKTKKFLIERLRDDHFVSLKLERTENRIRKLIND